MPLKQNDFIEIEFTAKTKDGDLFDSNISKDLKEADSKAKAKPFVFCLGQEMFLKGIDDFLIGKEVGKYKIELEPEKAFGKRNASLVQMVPIKVFKEQQINPTPGIVLNFDGKLGKILTVSGGRILVDFNNPLSGKDVIYDLKILRKVDNLDEKIKALNDFLFRKDFEFKVEDKKVILEVEKGMEKFVEMFKDKYKDLLNLNLEVKGVEAPEKKIEGSEKK